MSTSIVRTKGPPELQRELQIKSKLLEKTLDEFTRTTTDLSRLSHDISLRQIEDFGRVAESTAEGFWSKHLDEYTSKHAKPSKENAVANGTSDPEVTEMQVELGRLCREEQQYKEVHRVKCAELQDIWNKLVSLRAHMTSFRAGIEEMSLEEIHHQATHRNSSNGYSYQRDTQPSNTDSAVSRSYYELLELGTDEAADNVSNDPMRISHSAAAADRLVDMHILKEKVRTRDALRHKSHLIQERLDELRRQIDISSEELSHAAQLGDRVPHSLQRAMTCRQRILSLSQQLEEEEMHFVSINQQLLTIESEVSQALENEASNSTLRSDNLITNAAVSDKGHWSVTKSATPTTVKCEFSLDEVLLGKAKISRMNGESASQFRIRLQKRLASLSVLATQLEDEVQEKAKAVKHAQDALKEAEVRRLRHELQIANICGVLHRKQIEAHVAAASVDSTSAPAELHQYRNGQLSGRELLSKLLRSDTKSEVSDDAGKSLPSSWLASALGYRAEQHMQEPPSTKASLSRKSSRLDEAVDLLLSTEPIAGASPAQPPPLTLADLDDKMADTPAPIAAITPPALQQRGDSHHDENSAVGRHHKDRHGKHISRSPSPERRRHHRHKHRRSRRRHYHYSTDSSTSSVSTSSSDRHYRKECSHRSPSPQHNRKKSERKSLAHRKSSVEDSSHHSHNEQKKKNVTEHVDTDAAVVTVADSSHMAATPQVHGSNLSDVNVATQLQQLLAALAVQDQASAAAIKSSLLQVLDETKAEASAVTPVRSNSGSPGHRIRRDDSPVHDTSYYYSTKKQPFHRIEARFARRSSSGVFASTDSNIKQDKRSRSPPRRANTAPVIAHSSANVLPAAVPLPPVPLNDSSPKSKWVSAAEGMAQVAYTPNTTTKTTVTATLENHKPTGSPITSPLRLLREKKRLESVESLNNSSYSSDGSSTSTSSNSSTSITSTSTVPSELGDTSAWLAEEISQPQSLLIRGPGAKENLTSQLCRCLEHLNEAKLLRSKGSNHNQLSAHLRVTVVTVRNLPEMKRMTRSADAYVRMLVTASAEDNAPLTCSQLVNSETKRTQTKWGELYPHWKEEEFKMHLPMTDKKSLGLHRVYFYLMDAARSGEDVHIGTCWLPLKSLLDQRKHTFWLKIDFSDGLKKQRVIKMQSECALRVDAQLTHNRIRQLQQRIKNIQSDLAALNSNEWVLKKGQNERNRSSPPKLRNFNTPSAKRSVAYMTRERSPSPQRRNKSSRPSPSPPKKISSSQQSHLPGNAVIGIHELIEKNEDSIHDVEDDLSSPTDFAVAEEPTQKPQSNVNLSIFRGAGVKIVPPAKKSRGKKKIGFLGSSDV